MCGWHLGELCREGAGETSSVVAQGRDQGRLVARGVIANVHDIYFWGDGNLNRLCIPLNGCLLPYVNYI